MRIDYTEVRRLYNVPFVDYEMNSGREVVDNIRKEASQIIVGKMKREAEQN